MNLRLVGKIVQMTKRNQGQEDDPSQHDILRSNERYAQPFGRDANEEGVPDFYPEGNEMREENLGPVMNPNGSPSEITLQMFGITREEWQAKQDAMERKPNQYISPFLDWVIKGWLKNFLQENQDVPWNSIDIDANDSWAWTVEEARRLFQKLS